MPFTPGAKKILELAASEAIRPGHGIIGTEHLLLGLAAGGDVERVLSQLGTSSAQLHRDVIAALSGDRPD